MMVKEEEEMRLIFSRFSDTLGTAMRIVLIIFCILIVQDSVAQSRVPQQRKFKKDSLVGEEVTSLSRQQRDVRALFGQIQHGLLNLSLLSSPSLFANQVSVSIRGGETGYYSANQVLSVLQEYFAGKKPFSFEFSRFEDEGSTPYATGRLTYIAKGNRESVQVYVSLVQQEGKWLLGQVNIY
jgi:hypothetical protein